MNSRPDEENFKVFLEIDEETQFIDRMIQYYDKHASEMKRKAAERSEFDPGESTLEWKLENSPAVNKLLLLQNELNDGDRRTQQGDILISADLGEWLLEACENILDVREEAKKKSDGLPGIREKIGGESLRGAIIRVAMRNYQIKFFRILRHQYEFSREAATAITVNVLNTSVSMRHIEVIDKEIVGYKAGKPANYVSTLECDDRWIRGFLDKLDEPCIRGILDKLKPTSPQRNALLEALKRKRKAK